MAKSYALSGSFNPDELAMLARLYKGVCRGVEKKGTIALTPRVREAIAITVFRLASAGECEPRRMRRLAMQEVEAYGGVQRTLERIVKRAPNESPSHFPI